MKGGRKAKKILKGLVESLSKTLSQKEYVES